VQGTVKWFNTLEGIRLHWARGWSDVFVHYSAITRDGTCRATGSDPVEFEDCAGTKGPQASNVQKDRVESGLQLFEPEGSAPLLAICILRWTAAASQTRAGSVPRRGGGGDAIGIKKPALQMPAQLKTETEFPLIGAWTTKQIARILRETAQLHWEIDGAIIGRYQRVMRRLRS